MLCEHCRNEIADTAAFCSVCGMAVRKPEARAQIATSYGPSLQGRLDEFATFPQNYTPQADIGAFVRAKATFQPPYRGSLPPHNAGPTPVNGSAYAGSGKTTIAVSNKNDSALIVEVILSLFGLFGIGWLIAGETVTGVVLLVCSILIYWPIMIIGTMFTFGIGLICLGPLAIGAIILNTLLLNTLLNHRATQFVVMHTPHPPTPPQS